MVKLGIVVFANDSGLGAQTRRLCEMLRPFRLLAIDSSGFSKNKDQHFDWYSGFSGYRVHGFPQNFEIRKFLEGLTHVLVCENPLNFYLFSQARTMGIRTYCQTNYEFCDNLNKPELPLPDMFLMPSYWKLEEMKNSFGGSHVTYLPPPINPAEFSEARQVNFDRKEGKNLLHVIGTLATHDRNGTLDVLKALKYTKENFTLTIKSQHELPVEYMVDDRRVSYKIGNEASNADLYKDYDAVIFPRRYGGLSLGMNEALMSGLPVIMTNISPNKFILPEKWLLNATKVDQFKARVPIDVYGVNPKELAKKIDYIVNSDLDREKAEAFELGFKNYADSSLSSYYEKLW